MRAQTLSLRRWLRKDKSIAEDFSTRDLPFEQVVSPIAYVDEKAAKSWLITILRRAETPDVLNAKQFDLVDIDDHGNDASVSDDPHHQHLWLQAQIMKLEIDYREPLFLQVIGGFSGTEIVDILGPHRKTRQTMSVLEVGNQLKEMLDTEEAERGQHNGWFGISSSCV